MSAEPSVLNPQPSALEKETGRLEAFSDGVFAIAVTLLVLELRAPLPGTLQGDGLLRALLHAWPSYLAFVTSFVTVLIMWINHHNLFRMIHRTDHNLLLLNGFLLLVVTFIPFPTNVLAEYIREPDARTAAIFYSGTFLVMAVAFNLLWRYASHGRRLLARDADERTIRIINKQFRIGPLSYVVCVVAAAINAVAGFVLVMALALYWALPEHLRPGPGRGE
jgi:uncharacterized membrane protein